MSKELTREEKVKLIEALEEKKRRIANSKPTYIPHSGQLEIHSCKTLERWALSGNSYGKSALLVNELKWLIEGYNPVLNIAYPPGLRVAMVVDTSRKIEENILRELKKWMHVDEKWLKRNTTKYISQLHTDQVDIFFYSADSDPTLFEGFNLNRIMIDEPIPRHLYISLKRAIREKSPHNGLLFCGTPIGQAWIRTDIFEPWVKGESPETTCFRGSTMQNIHNLDKRSVDDFVRALSPEERATRIEGAFFDAESMALAHLWKRDVHIVNQEPWDPSWPVVVGIDPHYSKPHVAVMVGANEDNKLVVLKELCLKKTAREFSVEMVEWMKGHRVVDIVCDSLGATDGTGNEGFASFITIANQVFRGRGLAGVRSTSFEDKSHEAAIDRLQTGLLIPVDPDDTGRRIPKLRVRAECKGVIENVESVGWVKNRFTGETKPKLDTGAKDFLSALCYALAANVNFNKGKEKPFYMKKSPYQGLSLKSLRRRFR